MTEYKHVPPNIVAFLRYFKWDHLPVKLQAYSAPFEQLARNVLLTADAAADLEQKVDWAEVMVGLRNILVAKDNVVRAFLP
jgi:hypothetical protein